MYMFGSDGDWGGANRLRLARVQANADLLDLASYEYFTGSGWTADIAAASDVLVDGNNLGGMQSILYNPVHQRYFLITFAEPQSPNARMVVYDAAVPWGPWFRCGTISKEQAEFTKDPLFHAVYNPSFNAKWVTPAGDMWMSYSNYTPQYTFHYGVVSIQRND